MTIIELMLETADGGEGEVINLRPLAFGEGLELRSNERWCALVAVGPGETWINQETGQRAYQMPFKKSLKEHGLN